MRTERFAEAAAQFLEDAARTLRVDLARHLDGGVVAVVASAHRAAEWVGVLLGRPLHGRDYDDSSVKVPPEIDVQRARRIIEELRKRFGDMGRPQEELDYIERLLKDY